MSELITTRIPEKTAKDIEYFIKNEHTDRSTFLRQMLVKGIEEKKIDYALKKYVEGEITIGKAAEIADIPLRKMLKIISEKKVEFQYSMSDLRSDFMAAK